MIDFYKVVNSMLYDPFCVLFHPTTCVFVCRTDYSYQTSVASDNGEQLLHLPIVPSEGSFSARNYIDMNISLER